MSQELGSFVARLNHGTGKLGSVYLLCAAKQVCVCVCIDLLLVRTNSVVLFCIAFNCTPAAIYVKPLLRKVDLASFRCDIYCIFSKSLILN
jgi:hypothetical protein